MSLFVAYLGQGEPNGDEMMLLNKISIDWVRFSVPTTSWPFVRALLNVSDTLDDWTETSKYRRKYATVPMEGVLVAADALPEEHNTLSGGRFTVDFSGNGLAHFFEQSQEWASLYDFFEAWLAQPDVKVNRLDIAFDCFDGLLDILRMHTMLMSGDKVLTRWRQAGIVSSYAIGAGDFTGLTLYIGARSSDSFARVYDKRAQELSRGAAEEALPPSWIRLELELKDARALSLAHAALREKFDAGVFTGFLRSRIDFLEGRDSNKQRLKPARWWRRFLHDVGKRPLQVPQPIQSIERIENWVNHSVAPSLALLMEHKGGDMAWLYKLLKDGHQRIPPDKKVLLSSIVHGS